MFGFIGKVIGTVTGGILGIASATIAAALGITEDMVDEAKEAGCETYEEIKEFFKL
jgi:hypothetical protein